ncbi:glycoside hydrolase family 38 N-terminal domain-containing protein [Streptomyces niveus]|uniref:glycoside hydrolase family 38 N-terminal domain-containing protein n=1 Tax=Streptomyces niveus TaxID=193462 RepID=UPI0036963568
MTTPDVRLVPHTHWDREWYEPFQRFRLRLVDLLDEVLDRAEADERFRFTLDGQMAAVDDYLEVRPEHRERVVRLVRRGQLAVGPWQILLDEFLCSGENIIRNLELGHRRATELGSAMPVGYLPDMFGHCAQMPQILSAAGLHHACVWRGVPAGVPGHAFRWQAPDGSSVRTEYLAGGYGNAAYVLSDPGHFAGRMADLGRRLTPAFGADPVLAMYGTDHSAPVGSLVKLVADLDPADVDVTITTLADYLGERDPHDGSLPVVAGELRSHAHANILPGVLSVRPHLKQALARAERLVERYAEPFAALWPAEWPEKFLDMAWWRLIDASGHDSVTGCGVDETATQVFARISEAGHLGQAVRDRVAGGLAPKVSRDAVLVLNPTPAARDDLVTVDLEVPDDWRDIAVELPDGSRLPAQTEVRGEHLLLSEALPGEELTAFLPRIHGRELFGGEITHWSCDDERRVLEFGVARHGGDTPFDVEAVRAAVTGARGDWTVRITRAAHRTVTCLARVPALGWTSLRLVRGAQPAQQPVRAEGRTLSNGLVTVTALDDGTFRVTAADGTVLDGVGRVVDGGDRGDSYNYAPPGTDTLVTTPRTLRVGTAIGGPLRAALTVERLYDWPQAVDRTADRRTAATRPGGVRLDVELRAGEPFVRLDLTLDNASLDHRVRLHVPLARPAETSHAEGQFAVVERGRTAEGGFSERPVPTFPAHGFVDAGGAGLLLTQACEYELLDREVALTVLRATGWLSRNIHPYRAEPAGPQLAVPAAQMVGTSTVSLAVLPHAGDWHDADLMAAAERYRHPLHAIPGSGPRDTPPVSHPGLSVEGAVMTSLRRRDGELEVRLVAASPEPTTAVVRGPFTHAQRVGLLGADDTRTTAPDAEPGTVRIPLRAWEIATVRLTGGSAGSGTTAFPACR